MGRVLHGDGSTGQFCVSARLPGFPPAVLRLRGAGVAELAGAGRHCYPLLQLPGPLQLFLLQGRVLGETPFKTREILLRGSRLCSRD